MTVAKHYSRVSETPCFPRRIHRKSPQTVNYYGDSKLLHRSIFSTAGFLWIQGSNSVELDTHSTFRGPGEEGVCPLFVLCSLVATIRVIRVNM